jgi:1-acyl-sn-glycerol-3-phosphate acyltransferase
VLFYWFLKFVAIGPVVKLVFHPRAQGTENVPATGPAILASNHLSAADWIFMPLSLRRRVTFLAKAEYFTGSGLKGRAQRVFFAGSGQVPIDRTNASAAEDAIRTGIRILTQGKLLGIYPEGTRSPDGRLFRGKTGIARMTLETGAPVVPVAMLYEPRRVPLPGKLGRALSKNLVRVVVRFGEPLDFSRYDGLSGDRFVERSITDEVMYEIMELSGQEYVDVYGAKVKKSMDTAGVSATEAVSRLQPSPHEAADRLPDSLAG